MPSSTLHIKQLNKAIQCKSTITFFLSNGYRLEGVVKNYDDKVIEIQRGNGIIQHVQINNILYIDYDHIE